MSVTQASPGISAQARAGFFGVLAVLIFGYSVSALLAWQRHREAGQPYHIIFNRVEGIIPGSEIWRKGQLVGHVRSMDVTEDGRADILIAIQRRNITLTKESKYDIQGMLFGERWLRIEPEGDTVVKPGGTVYGEGPERFSLILKQGLQTFDYLKQTAAGFSKQFGGTQKAQKDLRHMLSYYNDMAFDMRVQANRFNQFSGLITQQLDKMTGKLDNQIALSQKQADLMTMQMKLYAHTMNGMVNKSGTQMHAMLGGMKLQSVAMKDGMKLANTYMSGQTEKVNKMMAQLEKTKKSLDQAAMLVTGLHLLSHNPRLAESLKKQAHGYHMQAQEMREAIEKLQKSQLLKKYVQEAPAPVPTGHGTVPRPSPAGHPVPSPSPSPSASASPGRGTVSPPSPAASPVQPTSH